MSNRPQGIIAAPHTPFTTDGELNIQAIDTQAAKFKADGLDGVFICGTTGEGYAQTLTERKTVAERWASVRSDHTMIIHVGCHAQADSIELAKHTAQLGVNGDVHGIACMSPSFYRPQSAADLIAFLKPIAAAAPDLAFYYYHIPIMNNITLPMADFMTQAADAIPNLRGLKYTHPDMLELQRLVNLDNGRFDVMFGGDPYLLAAWTYGVRCAVGMAYNFITPRYHDMRRAFDNNALDTARSISNQLEQLRRILNSYGGIAATKAVMNTLGLNLGPVRPPLHTLSESETDSLRHELRTTGLFDNSSI